MKRQFDGVKALFFDYGGTLDVPARHWSTVIAEAYEHAGLSVAPHAYREAYVWAERQLGRPGKVDCQSNFAQLLRLKLDIQTAYLRERGALSLSAMAMREKLEQMVAYCDEMVRRNLDMVRPKLELLSRKYALLLVSNFYGNLRAILQNYDLLVFEGVIESAAEGVRKPNPELWRRALERAGCEPSQAVIVGDSMKNDIAPALELGCTSVWLKGEAWTDEPEPQNESLIVVSSFEEVAQLFGV